MACLDFKELPGRTASHKVLRDKAFNIDKNKKYYEYYRRLALMVHKFFDKKATSGGVVTSEIVQNKKLAEEINKAIIKKFEKRKVH